MTPSELQHLRSLCEQATPGPWQWFGNTNHHEVYLATVDRGRVFVMDFVRWGMHGAQPRFQVALNGSDDSGVMRSVGEMAKNEEVSKPAVLFGPLYEAPYRKQFTGIGHPDARFIAAARSAVPALIEECERLARLRDARRAVRHAARDVTDWMANEARVGNLRRNEEAPGWHAYVAASDEWDRLVREMEVGS